MLLAVDTGNSTICFAVFDNDKIIYCWKIITNKDKESDYYSTVLKELMRLDNFDENNITDIILSSVVPELTDVIKESLLFLTKNILVFDNKIKTGVKISNKIKADVGTDIIADISAGKSLYGENFIVIDTGTAITFNIALKNCEYVGSAILAGPQLSVKSLSESCSKLPLVEVKKPDNFIGYDNIDAIKTGTYYGYLGAIKEIISNIKAFYKDVDFKVILTGGKSAVFMYDLTFVDSVVPDLTLQGLNEIWKLNQNK